MNQVQLLSLLCLTGAAAICDARTQRIPNRLIVAGLLLAVAVRVGLAVAGVDPHSHRDLAAALLAALGSAALGLVGCALLPLLLYRAGALGGGDVKLLAVAGALIALGPGLELTRAALFVAVLFGFAKLALAGQLGRSLRTMGALIRRLAGARGAAPVEPTSLTPLPFGPHIFIAACYLALSSWTSASGSLASASAEPAPNAVQAAGD
ncbi:MAG TPA: A24 family peptidase [Polyangiaceae bacterium]|nr:A24 family peptidase [Polyangiaceae bacterium]